MHIQELLKDLSILSSTGPMDLEIQGLCIDSRKIQPGDAFICMKGGVFDSHSVALPLYQQGVRVFFCEREVPLPKDAAVIVLPEMRTSMSLLAQNFFEHPAKGMTLIGITGSKGKTTVAHMIYALLEGMGKTPGIIGTNGAWTGEHSFPISYTTPDPIELYRAIRGMRDKGCDSLVMEVSSFGMKYDRVSALRFDVGLFLNIEEGDHVGPLEHVDFEEYFSCKKSFLSLCDKTLIWSGEPKLCELQEGLQATYTYGRELFADYRLLQTNPVELGDEPGMGFTVEGKLNGEFKVHSLGEVGSLNALASLAAIDLLGWDAKKAAPALEKLHITGRMEWIYRSDDFGVLIDFAHNGLSARTLLRSLRQYKPKRLVCLFGVNGNRDINRREGMGKAAGQYADFSIITEGHTRNETFENILTGILKGMSQTHGRYVIIPERKNALEWALEQREPGDILAILGLGHEEHLEKEGRRIPHSDRQLVLNYLEKAEPSKDF